MGEASLGPTPPVPPPGPAPAPGVGAIRVEVTHNSVCWDTTPDGLPAPHEGATVRVTSGGVTRTGTTDRDGRVTLEDLPTGTCQVEVSDTGYRSAGPFPETITAGGTAMLMTSIDLARGGTRTVCNRQHTPVPPGAPIPGLLPPIFWHTAMMIVIREIAWLFLLACLITFLTVAAVDMADNGAMDWPTGGFCLPAMLLAAVAYLTHIIFGELVGIPTIVVAGLAWLAMIGLTIAAAVGALPMLPIHLVWFPSLCGMWVCFFVWLAIRFDTFNVAVQAWYIPFYALVSVAIALLLFFVLVQFTAQWLWADGLLAAYIIGVFFASWIGGIVSGAAGHVMNNDHNLTQFTAPEHPKLLPFPGYRYCVQGNRGWFSHFDTELLCYDFAVPQGSPVLAIEEGHVVEWWDVNEHSLYEASSSNGANYIYVENRDGKVARYLHLQKDGVRSINPVLLTNFISNTGDVYKTDVHVHAGQILGLAGSTGMSRFPHIHLGMYEGTQRGAPRLGLTFRDASVQRHGGKCYTFRPYQSDNADRGPISI